MAVQPFANPSANAPPSASTALTLETVLLREMDHRIKNVLATVQAIMTTTIRNATSLQDFETSFSNRLLALSKTQSLLTLNRQESALLSEMLDNELSVYEDGDPRRISCAGPPTQIPGHLAMLVGMALHELTTNAAKYGALHTPAGQLAVRWTVAKDILHLEWVERGIPDARPPQTAGFGTQLLTRILPGQTQSEVTLAYTGDGLYARLLIPLKAQPPEL